MGSPMGFPETSRKRTASASAETVTRSPSSKVIKFRLPIGRGRSMLK